MRISAVRTLAASLFRKEKGASCFTGLEGSTPSALPSSISFLTQLLGGESPTGLFALPTGAGRLRRRTHKCESIAARTRMKDVGVNILIFAAFIFTQRLSKVAHNLTAVASAPSVVDNILCHIHCLTSP